MEIRHFYHVFAAGGWAEAVTEHAEALGAARFPGPVTAGLTGPQRDRDRARERITGQFEQAGAPVPDTWIEADEGWEQVTLAALRDYAITCPGLDAVLYAHTKGAGSNSALNPVWRRSMTRYVVRQWKWCANLVTRGSYDTAGCHWLTPEQHHHPPVFQVHTPFYGGNFWWARASYVRALKPPGTEYRHQAEEWIGLGNPRAADLLPGWPSMALCASPHERAQWQDRIRQVRGPAAELTCAHADETCLGHVTWASISRFCLDADDSVPLCRSHRARHESTLTAGR